jgi:hypothetical protein
MTEAPYAATVQVIPAMHALPSLFTLFLGIARSGGAAARRFSYRNVEFHDDKTGPRAVISGLDQPLPDVFDGVELTVGLVIVSYDDPPETVPAQPGRYLGHRHGFLGVTCHVDPEGIMTEGRPEIYASGNKYAETIAFFKKVMSGELEPDRQLVRGS